MQAPRDIFLLVAVWGETYIEDYLSMSLPCQLAPDNLPLLAKTNEYVVNYIIVTDSIGRAAISEHESFKHLQKFAVVTFVDLSQIEQKVLATRNQWRRFPDNVWQKYAVKMACMAYGIDKANQCKGLFIPLMSDLVISSGAFSYLLKQSKLGKKCVLVGSLKVNKESFLKDTHHLYFANNACYNFTGKQLVQKSIKHLHAWTYLNSVLSDRYDNSWPDYLYWILPEYAVIQSGNFCYPFLIDCSTEIAVPSDHTIDTMALPFDEQEYHVVTNPNECMVMVLEDESTEQHHTVGVFDPVSVATFRVNATKHHHQLFSRHNVVFGDASDPVVREFIEKVQQQTNELVELQELLEKSCYLNKQLYLRTIIESLGRQWLSDMPLFVESVVDNNDSIIAYGAGNELKALLALTKLSTKLRCVVDSNVNLHGSKFENVDVISLTQLTEQLTAGDVILLSSQRHHKSMSQQLQRLNISGEKVINPYQ